MSLDKIGASDAAPTSGDGITSLLEPTGGSDDISEAEWQARVELAACYRAVDLFGWTDLIGNHISTCVPGEPGRFLLNEFGLTYGEVTASNLVKVDLQGRTVGTATRPVNLAGFIIHSAIHEARPDAYCVLHTHTVADNAIAALEEGLLPLTQTSAGLTGQIGYHDYEGPALRPDEKARLVANLGDKPVLVLRNHGMVTVGGSVAEAFSLTYKFQLACQMQIAILSCGRPFRLIPEEVTARSIATYARFRKATPALDWQAVVRLVDARDPGYRS
jgi:ribulose-5-phosphate 4-epimerase/fuculose-1-phosphate aldolase